MRRYEPHLEVANFHLTFGSKELIDHVQGIVIPAFFSPMNTKERAYEERPRWFHELAFQELPIGDGVTSPAIIGRFVKHIVYRSNQVEVEGKLVATDEELPSDPSSIFVLLLDSHRLLFVREFPNSPKLDEFDTFIVRALSRARHEYIRKWKEFLRMKKKAEGGKEKVPKIGDLEKRLPPAKLELIPIANAAESATLVRQMKMVTSFTVKFVKTNSEGLVGSLLEDARKAKTRLGADNLKIEAKAREGLNKEATSEAVKTIADKGIAKFEAKGTSESGVEATVTEKDTTVKAPVPNLPKNIDAAGPQMAQALNGLVSTNLMPAPPRPPGVVARLKELLPSIKSLIDRLQAARKVNEQS